MEALTAFEKHYTSLEKEAYSREKQQRRRVERIKRDSFRNLISKLTNARLITFKTSWSTLVKGFDPDLNKETTPDLVQIV